ncbi:MAG: protein kinase [Planctomycetes bacterium]|nr:protein kinase [Planctomycetota bacterium]
MASRPIRNVLFGMLAVRSRFISQEQLDECLAAQKDIESRGGQAPRLGEILEQKGYLTRRQIETLVQTSAAKADRRRFGEIGVEFQFVSKEQVEAAAEMQEMLGRGATEAPLAGPPLGVFRAFLNEARSGNNRPKIGEILVALGNIRAHQVDAVLEEQGKRIVPCPFCRASMNITNLRIGHKVRCAECSALLEVIRGADGRPDLEMPPQTQIFQKFEDAATPPPAAPPPAAPPAAAASTEPIEVERPKRIVESRTPMPRQIGDFRLVTRLGEDGTGTIFKAMQLSKNRAVALKVMRSSAMNDAAYQARFLEEARKAAALEHPNIKRILAVGKYDGRFCVAMEFIEAESVYHILEKQGPMHFETAIAKIRPVLEAMAYAHRRGVVHGDIRPSQILVERDGTVKLANLGLAAKLSDNILAISETGQSAPFYVAPEMVTGDRETDHRVDIYSLGATLFHMISGKAPYKGKSYFEVLVRLSQEQIPPLKFFDPTIPDKLTAIVHRMLDPEPDGRYDSLDLVLRDLDDVKGHGGVGVAAAHGPVTRARVAVAALALAGILGLIGWRVSVSGDRQSELDALRRKAAATIMSRAEYVSVRGQLTAFASRHSGSSEAADAERIAAGLRKREEDDAAADLEHVRTTAAARARDRKFGEALQIIEASTFWKPEDPEMAGIRRKVSDDAAADWKAVEAEALKLQGEGRLPAAREMLLEAVQRRRIPEDAEPQALLLARLETLERKRLTDEQAALTAKAEAEARERARKQREESAEAWKTAEAEVETALWNLDVENASAQLQGVGARLVPEDLAAAEARQRDLEAVRALREAAIEEIVATAAVAGPEGAPDKRVRLKLKSGAEGRANGAEAEGVTFVEKEGRSEVVAWGNLDAAAYLDLLRRPAEKRDKPELHLAAGLVFLARAGAADPVSARSLMEEAERRFAAASAGGLQARAAAGSARAAAYFEKVQRELLDRAARQAEEGHGDEAMATILILRNTYGRRRFSADNATEIDGIQKKACTGGAPAESSLWLDFTASAVAPLAASPGWKCAGGVLSGNGEEETLKASLTGIQEVSFLIRFPKPEFRLTIVAGDVQLRLEPSRDRFDLLSRRGEETPVQKSLRDRFESFKAREWHHVRLRVAGEAVEVALDGAVTGSVPLPRPLDGLSVTLSGVSTGQAGAVELDDFFVKRK